MSRVVVEVGPATVRSPNPADAELVSAALDAIDDELVLVGERAVSVPELWTELMRVAVGDADTVVLVCPTWWSSARIDRVRHATAAPDVEVIGRTALLQGRTRATVVEIAPELIVVTRPGPRAVVIANVGQGVVEQVVAAAASAGPVLIDGPGGPLTNDIFTRLRHNGIEARLVEVRAIDQAPPTRDHTVAISDANRPRRTAVVVGVVASTVAVCGALGLRGGGDRAPDIASTVLAEGRVQVVVPAGWPVEHITTGPGSARVQITSPSDDGIALHLTQSLGPPEADLTQTAASLRNALSDEPGDVFVDFNPVDSRAGRTAVTYRELRADHHVAWTVLADTGVRIAIGCQTAPGDEERVRDVCDQAIRSAHAIT
jgi:type VII secretion-associated protein (TIGR03931 family)